MPPRQFGDEQRFIARQENSAFSLILSLPPQGFRAPEGRARPCGTTNTNILPQRGFSTPAFPAACTQHIPLFPGSFPAPTPQLPHSRGARCALERSLPSLAFPGPGRQWSPQGSIPQKPPAPVRSRCPQSALGAHKCAFSEPRSKGDILARQAFPSYFWERLEGSWGRNGGLKTLWGLVTELLGLGLLRRSSGSCAAKIPAPSSLQAGAGIDPKHPLSGQQKRPLTRIPGLGGTTSPAFKAPRSRNAGILPMKHPIPGCRARQQFHEC